MMRQNTQHYQVNLFQLVGMIFLSALASCSGQKELTVKRAGVTAAATAGSVTPPFAKPSDEVTVTGKDFLAGKAYKAVFKLADSTTKEAPMTVVNDTTATFAMPDGLGTGEKNFDIIIGQRTVNSFSIVATDGGSIAYYSGDASEMCSSKTFLDKSGKVQTGTKDCATGSVADCTADGQTGCRTTSSYKSVDVSFAIAGNIKSSITLGGTLGTFSGGFSNCASDSEVGCITTASFKAADMSVAVSSNIKTGITIAGAAGNIVLPTASNVYTGITFGAASALTGILTIPTAGNVRSTFGSFGVGGNSVTPSLGDCSSAGQQTCVATGTYFAGTACAANGSACYLPTYALTTQPLKAIDYDNVNTNAAKMRTTLTVSGVVGTLADCSANGAQGCVTTATYKSGDLTNLTAANIKSGVTIAGQAGDYPSATNTLTGASATADLDAATFNAKVKSATAFEYWDSTGARQTGAGDADITAANIANTVDIFSTTGTYTGTSPNAWDVRAGVTVGSTTGKLQVNCRNGATLGTFDQAEYPKSATVDNSTEFVTVPGHGWSDNQTVRIYFSTPPSPLSFNTTYYVRNSTANTFQLSATSGGTAIDVTADGTSVFVYTWGDAVTQIWDTIDDNIGYASSIPTYTGWSAANNVCGGIESIADDANVWKDVTTTGDGVTASTCTATAAHCSMKDKISGLEWHKPDSTGRDWTTALSFCDSLSYNGKTDWRLPTQKELMAAYSDGIRSTANATNWITSGNLQQNYLSSSSVSNAIYNAWLVNPAFGLANTSYNKNTTNRVICVRP